MRSVRGALAALALLVSSVPPAAAQTPIFGSGRAERAPQAGHAASAFDFYVLSLSWSPSWCAENDRGARTAQCRKAHGFIVHGLWPQAESGFPQFCRSSEPARVPERLGRSLFDLMPSMGLIGHQWRKHGTCSGLSQADYFQTLRAARERITLPPALDDAEERLTPAAIERLLTEANPGLTPDGLAVTCDGGKLDEVRICLTKDLDFRACREVDRAGCRARTLTIPSSR